MTPHLVEIGNAKRAASKEVQELMEHYFTLRKIYMSSPTPMYLGDKITNHNVAQAKAEWQQAINSREALNKIGKMEEPLNNEQKIEIAKKKIGNKVLFSSIETTTLTEVPIKTFKRAFVSDEIIIWARMTPDMRICERFVDVRGVGIFKLSDITVM